MPPGRYRPLAAVGLCGPLWPHTRPGMLGLPVSPGDPGLLGSTLLKSFAGQKRREPSAALPFLVGLVEQYAHWDLSDFLGMGSRETTFGVSLRNTPTENHRTPAVSLRCCSAS